MEVDPTRMCELLVGLPDVTVLGVDDERDGPMVVHIESRSGAAGAAGLRRVGVGEGPAAGGAGRPAVLRAAGPAGVAQAPVALPRRRRARWGRGPVEDLGSRRARAAMTDRAGRWVTVQVGRLRPHRGRGRPRAGL